MPNRVRSLAGSVVAIVMVLAALLAGLYAQQGISATGSISGSLVASDGTKPMAGVRVVLSNPERNFSRETVTNQRGEFQLNGIPATNGFVLTAYRADKSVVVRKEGIALTAGDHLITPLREGQNQQAPTPVNGNIPQPVPTPAPQAAAASQQGGAPQAQGGAQQPGRAPQQGGAPPQQPKPPSPNSEAVFRNVKFFRGKPAVDLMAAMTAMDGGLGVQCSFCHYGNELEKDGKKEKEDARKYLELTAFVNDNFFRGRPRVGCWSCHNGQEEPAKLGPDAKAIADARDEIGLKAEDENKPAEEVFKNIVKLRGTAAGRIPEIMATYARSVGHDCTFCHVMNKWEADDKKPKQTAREMITLVNETTHKFFGDQGPVTCFTCHHGHEEAERLGPWERPPQRPQGQGQPGQQPPPGAGNPAGQAPSGGQPPK